MTGEFLVSITIFFNSAEVIAILSINTCLPECNIPDNSNHLANQILPLTMQQIQPGPSNVFQPIKSGQIQNKRIKVCLFPTKCIDVSDGFIFMTKC